MITFDDIPEELKLQKGRHKGGLNQKLLQVDGSFEDGDSHPFGMRTTTLVQTKGCVYTLKQK